MKLYNQGSESDKSKGNSFEEKLLILHNDEINTFDHVIESLQEVCDHDEIQAEQCAIITHLKGHCEIKIGATTQLEELRNQLAEKSLIVSIDSLL